MGRHYGVTRDLSSRLTLPANHLFEARYRTVVLEGLSYSYLRNFPSRSLKRVLVSIGSRPVSVAFDGLTQVFL